MLPSLKKVRRGWTEIISRQTGQRIDLEAELMFDYHTDSGMQEHCTTTEYDKEVLDYIEKKQVEERINDSTVVTKIVEIKHYKKVYASVTECQQSRNISAYGWLEVYRPGLNAPEWKAVVSGTEGWSNKFSFGSGDARALPAFANSGSNSVPPPANLMLINAVTSLPWAAQWQLTNRYVPKAIKPRRLGSIFGRR